jgi:hypothetical protein
MTYTKAILLVHVVRMELISITSLMIRPICLDFVDRVMCPGTPPNPDRWIISSEKRQSSIPIT